MKFKVLLIVLILLASVIPLNSNQAIYNQSASQQQSYEKLIIKENYYRIEFAYGDSKSNIPHQLKYLLKNMSIKSLVLEMGYIKPSALQNVQYPPLNHGISLFLTNTTILSHQNFKTISQLFSISRSSQFMIYLQQAQVIYANNPNDKFCSHHLKNMIDMFLPCRNSAGIGSIINDKTFLVQKSFVGFKLSWVIGQGVNLQFYIDKGAAEVRNYLKLPAQKRYVKRCMHLDQFSIKDKSYKKAELNQLDLKDQSSFLPSIMFTSSFSNQFCSNYYHPNKLLTLSIDFVSIARQIKRQHYDFNNKPKHLFDDVQTLTSRVLFPKGFLISDITFMCDIICQQTVSMISSQVQTIHSPKRPSSTQLQTFTQEEENQSYLVKFLINFQKSNSPLQNYQGQSNDQSQERSSILKLNIHYKSHLKSFEQYETIAGGGQELTNIPLTIKLKNNITLLVLSNKKINMFDRLLQPDFSIPFKTITFTVAIFGYIWIAIWRAFYSQMQASSKKSQRNKSTLHEDVKIPKQRKQQSSQEQNCSEL